MSNYTVRDEFRGDVLYRIRDIECASCGVIFTVERRTPAKGCWPSRHPECAKTHHLQQNKTMKQKVRGGEHTRRSFVEEPSGFKRCTRCCTIKPLVDFHKSSVGRRGVMQICKPCNSSQTVEYRKTPQWRSNNLYSRFRITGHTYDEMLLQQGGGCAICGKTPEENGMALAVDHDHSCCPGKKSCGKCVRQLLCHQCNGGLGMFNDSVELFQEAIFYIEFHRDRLNLNNVA